MTRHRFPQAVAALAIVLGTVGCSPALNWRAVRIEALSALLPCKPDQAQRKVPLAGQALPLQVAGCETAGALYALSHVRVADSTQVEATRNAWHQATVATLQASAAPGVPAASGTVERLEGKKPDGSRVRAQLLWLTKGQDIYQVAVYGPTLDKDMTELLFSELRLQ